ncbi:MAG: signal peptidase II [Phycisphaerales bacterium]|nr:signal peptidase II [Phycisphaerales bacterium]
MPDTVPTSAAPAPHPHRPFVPVGLHRGPWLCLLITIVLGLVADLGSKYWAFHAIADRPFTVDRDEVLRVKQIDPHMIQSLVPDHEPFVVVPKLLQFQIVLNPGAVFGSGAGKRWFFIAFTVVALIFAGFLFARWTARRDRLAHVAIGLVIAGGIGNLYDRLVYACVRDFIHPFYTATMPFGITWPSGSNELWPYVSNVADAFLLVGIGLLVIRLWRHDAGPSPARG